MYWTSLAHLLRNPENDVHLEKSMFCSGIHIHIFTFEQFGENTGLLQIKLPFWQRLGNIHVFGNMP